jgi:hypothetical protein
MKLKIFIGIVAAAMVGALGMWQGQRMASARNQDAARARAEADELRRELERTRENEDLRAELSRLNQALATISNQAVRAATPQPPPASADLPVTASDGQPEAPKPRKMSPQAAEGVANLVQGAVDFQIKAQIERARERLNLAPTQEQAIRGIVDDAVAEGRENLKRLLSGDAPLSEVPTAEDWAMGLERKILAQLTPEQQSAYQYYKEEDITATARLAANDELLRSQAALGLSQAQQDQMFQALFAQSVLSQKPREAAQAGRPQDPVAAFEWQIAQKVRAVEPILTPAQVDTYRQMQEGPLKFVKWLSSLGETPAQGATR